jgi:hypothetical protein
MRVASVDGLKMIPGAIAAIPQGGVRFFHLNETELNLSKMFGLTKKTL